MLGKVRSGISRYWRWSRSGSKWRIFYALVVPGAFVLLTVAGAIAGPSNKPEATPTPLAALGADGDTSSGITTSVKPLQATSTSEARPPTKTPKPAATSTTTREPSATKVPTSTPPPSDTPTPLPTATPAWQDGAPLNEASVLDALKHAKKMARSLDLSKPVSLQVFPGPDGNGKIALIYKAGDALSETDLLTIGAQTSFSADRTLFANPLVDSTDIRMTADWVDQYGKTTEDRTTESSMTRDTANRIDWSGLEDRVLLDNKLFFCISDSYFIHPAIYVRLKDKGCLT